ncbi:MAG: GNAT family N-acetyltransferase [Candidatus Micrarchaeales archaeon]
MEIRSNNFHVYLSSLGIEDADAIAKKANSYQVAFNIAEWGSFPHPYNKPDALAFIEFATKANMEGREVHLGIHLVETNELIGIVGLKNINVKNKKAEVGFWIGQDFWKKGYGTESVSMIVEYGFSKLNLHKMEAMVFTFNEASVRILEKLGFMREGLLRDHVFHKDDFADDLLLGLLKNDYKSKISISVK